LTDWLGDADRVADLGRRLRAGGVPADRVALFRRTLHPEILGRATVWAPNRPVEIFDRDHGIDLSIRFVDSPLDQAMAEGVSRALTPEELEHGAWNWADPFRGLGLSALLIRPLPRGAALVVGTRQAEGFADRELAVLDRLAGSLGAKQSGSGRVRKNAIPP
jgi:hypothetical protein